jgi:hypothetical protein
MGFNKYVDGAPDTAVHIREEIVEIHDAKEMIPHRRRGFEYNAMLDELLDRAGLTLPRPLIPAFVRHTFFLIYSEKGTGIANELKASLESRDQGVVDDIYGAQ